VATRKKKTDPYANETPEERQARYKLADEERARVAQEKKDAEIAQKAAVEEAIRNFKMPPRRFNPQVANFPMGELIRRFVRAGEEGETSLGEKRQWLTDREFVMGYPLPEFQRPPCWKEEQQISFIESIWLGLSPGSYVVNDFHHGEWVKLKDGREGLHPLFWLLIDGQQRLRALQAYLEGEFKVFGFRWDELNRLEQRRFEGVQFPRVSVYLTNETELRDFYNRMNFGGTPHTEDQRA
jgi:Protein of unknown function DUF262